MSEDDDSCKIPASCSFGLENIKPPVEVAEKLLKHIENALNVKSLEELIEITKDLEPSNGAFVAPSNCENDDGTDSDCN